MGRLDNKVAIITGGNSGIGAKAAELFASEGAKVVISARRVDKLAQVAQRITQAGGQVLAIPCDISKAEQCDKLVAETLAAFGDVDILVNNAGVLDSGLEAIEKVSDQTIDYLVDINLKGTLYMTRAVAKKMVADKNGSIVNVSSVAGYCGNGGAAYVASKAGVIGLTKNIAMRTASLGIRCNAVCPGTIVTPMVAGMNPANMDADMFGAMAKHSDLRAQPCMPQDVANIILFLASDESRAITGQALVTDFGSTL